jgi:hypothetical protein
VGAPVAGVHRHHDKEAGRNRVERIDMKGAPDPDDRERLRRRGPQGVDVDPDTA